MSHRTTRRALIRSRVALASSPNPPSDRPKSRIGSYSFLLLHLFENLFEQFDDSDTRDDWISISRCSRFAKPRRNFGHPKSPATQSHSIRYRFQGISDRAEDVKQILPCRVFFIDHQNRPPLMARSFLSSKPKTSRYTASPSPGSEPSCWMHSMR